MSQGHYIGAAARLTGATAKAIRLYESLGLVPAPERAGKYRVYTDEAIGRIRLIKCAQQLGFSLRELERIFGSHQVPEVPIERVLEELARKRDELLARRRAIDALLSDLDEFEQGLRQGVPPPGIAAPLPPAMPEAAESAPAAGASDPAGAVPADAAAAASCSCHWRKARRIPDAA